MSQAYVPVELRAIPKLHSTTPRTYENLTVWGLNQLWIAML